MRAIKAFWRWLSGPVDAWVLGELHGQELALRCHAAQVQGDAEKLSRIDALIAGIRDERAAILRRHVDD